MTLRELQFNTHHFVLKSIDVQVHPRPVSPADETTLHLTSLLTTLATRLTRMRLDDVSRKVSTVCRRKLWVYLDKKFADSLDGGRALEFANSFNKCLSRHDTSRTNLAPHSSDTSETHSRHDKFRPSGKAHVRDSRISRKKWRKNPSTKHANDIIESGVKFSRPMAPRDAAAKIITPRRTFAKTAPQYFRQDYSLYSRARARALPLRSFRFVILGGL